MQKMDMISARCAEFKAVLTVLAHTPFDESCCMFTVSGHVASDVFV